MIDRYATARALGQEHYRGVVDADRKLLDQFGLNLLSIENTVQVANKRKVRGGRVNPWDVISITPALWEWLRPTLVEMAELQRIKSPGSVHFESLELSSLPHAAK
jgi:hypothetical protein